MTVAEAARGGAIRVAGATVLVTGANGTVGRAVVRRFATQGASVRAMSRRPHTPEPAAVRVVQAELGDRDALARAVEGADLVVHCAASLDGELDECIRVNVEGTANLLDAMRRAGTQALVHLSTVSVYDPRGGLDFHEDCPLWREPLNAYGYTKAEAERRIVAAAAHGLRSTLLRPVMVLAMNASSYWGPLALARAAEASPQALVVSADFHYVHVDNLAQAVLLAAESPMHGRAYDVMDGIGASLDYLRAVSQALGYEEPTLPSRLFEVSVRGQRIRDELGYAPVDRWREFLDQLSQATPPAGTPSGY